MRNLFYILIKLFYYAIKSYVFCIIVNNTIISENLIVLVIHIASKFSGLLFRIFKIFWSELLSKLFITKIYNLLLILENFYMAYKNLNKNVASKK